MPSGSELPVPSSVTTVAEGFAKSAPASATGGWFGATLTVTESVSLPPLLSVTVTVKVSVAGAAGDVIFGVAVEALLSVTFGVPPVCAQENCVIVPSGSLLCAAVSWTLVLTLTAWSGPAPGAAG